MIPSTELDWQRSVYVYRRRWADDQAPERLLAARLEDNNPNALADAATYFQVRRTLPGDTGAMDRITGIVHDYDVPENIGERLIAIAHLANQAAIIATENGGRYQRPVSAMSKFLMLRYPGNSFVYDKNARITLAAANMVDERRLRDLAYFVACWRKHAYPIIEHLRNHDFEHNPVYQDAAGAARLVDKFLWMRGRDHPDAQIDETPDDQLGPINESEAIWRALAEVDITQLP